MGFRALYQLGRARTMALLAAVAIVATAIFAVTAEAAPPMPEGCISLTSCATAEAAAVNDPTVAFGSSVTFDYSLTGKMAKKYRLSIQVTCRQGSTPVYNWFGQPDFAFPLYSPPGDMYDWRGGDADCTAFLHYSTRSHRDIVALTTFRVTDDR